MKRRSGKLFIISGTSQVGKTTVARALARRRNLRVTRIVTATTRPQRPEDKLATYHFLTTKQFKTMLQRGELLEWAKVHHHYYGTPRRPVAQALTRGRNVLLVIDVQGAQQILKIFPTAVTIFITAESRAEIKRRILESNHIPDNQKPSRWQSTLKELQMAKRYQHRVVNRWGQLPQTVAAVSKIIKRRLKDS